jgi:hypothetical protein
VESNVCFHHYCIPLLTFRNTWRPHSSTFERDSLSEVSVADTDRKKTVIGTEGIPAIHPSEPRKLAQPGFTVANPKQWSGSSGVLTVSFFAPTGCQNFVQNTSTSSMNSHSLQQENTSPTRDDMGGQYSCTATPDSCMARVTNRHITSCICSLRDYRRHVMLLVMENQRVWI